MVDQTCSTSLDEARFDSARLMLASWAAEVPDGLIRKSLVVDRLLDLRAELADEPLLKIEVDQLLANTPGNTVVEAAWWLSSVSSLTDAVTARALAAREMSDDSETAVEP